MTGSTRLTSITSSSVRAPYSAPQATVASLRPPTRNFDPETGAALRLPAPFVPREFRASNRSDVTAVPPTERVEASNVIATEPLAAATSVEALFSDDIAPASDFASFLESHDLDANPEQGLAASEPHHSVELPWIDAFAADLPEAEETWPLGEAGKRLDELTQSLSSLDASRDRMHAAEDLTDDAPAAPDPALPMWNEEEWIDIMPMLPADLPQEELELSTSHSGFPGAAAEMALPAITVNAESAARALEGLAQRVRAGEVPVPAFPCDLGPEAMLAGLLAAMLGWRQ